ncbi:hypothetical protein A4A49_62022, partial [Nicotiana attenuata]
MGNRSLNPNPSFTQSRKQKKHKNGKKHPYDHPSDHGHHQPSASGPRTGFLVGGSLARTGDLLRIHTGQQKGDGDSPKSGSPCQSDCRSPEQSTSSFWPSPMAVDGELRQPIADYGPLSPKQSYSPKLPVHPILPRPNEGGPSSRAGVHPDRPISDSLLIYAKANEQTLFTPQYPARSLQSTGPTEKQGCNRRTGANLPDTKNGVDSPRFGKVDRVQSGSERNSGGALPQIHVQVRNEPGLSPNTGTSQSTAQSHTNIKSEKEVPSPTSAISAKAVEPPRW